MITDVLPPFFMVHSVDAPSSSVSACLAIPSSLLLHVYTFKCINVLHTNKIEWSPVSHYVQKTKVTFSL